ncbi:MAG: flagellar hook-associated protein FlgL [Planctomycetota bacterium]
MSFRVTQSQMAITARGYFEQQTSELSRVQHQISSGVRFHRPSEDPASLRQSLIQLDRVNRFETHEATIQHVKSRLQQSEVYLSDANEALTRAKEIALQAPQITDSSERQVLARELDGILEQIISVANSRDDSGYLFSGTAAEQEPFPGLTKASGDGTGRATYAGTSERTQLYLAGDVSRPAMVSGDSIFQSASRLATVIIGNSGTTTGDGTDTATGVRQLVISHTATTYAAGSGVTAGSSSVGGDTILGPLGTHQLQINDTSGTGTSGTISLNGGPPVAFTNTDTNLEVVSGTGDRVYLNTTAITPGFNGTVDLTGDGTMSIDGGLTSTAINFSANQTLTDSRDGSVVHVSTSGTRRTGTDQLEFPGTNDAFNAIRALRDDILNTRNLAPQELQAALNRRTGDIERIQENLLDVLGVQAVSMQQIERLEARTGDLKLAEERVYSETTSADIATAVMRLQELNNLQQFTMMAVGQLLTPNLLNYIS